MTFPYTGGIPLTSFITTTGSTDTFPTHVDFLGYGGYSAVADVTARNAITSQRRSFGCKFVRKAMGKCTNFAI